MQQLQVVRRVRTASAAPDPMMDLVVLLRETQRLTTDRASSLLSLPKGFDPPATGQRLGQLPTHPCFQVRFPPRIVGIDGAPDLHVTNDRPCATTSRSVERRDGGKCHHIPISH